MKKIGGAVIVAVLLAGAIYTVLRWEAIGLGATGDVAVAPDRADPEPTVPAPGVPDPDQDPAATVQPASGGPAKDTADLLEGSMRKLVLHPEPKPAGDADFMSFEGAPLNLADWQGKWVVVNFWATWCAPCRKEMPMLSALQDDLGGETFEVLTIATTRNAPAKMKAFFDDIGVSNLPLHRDPKSALARQMSVLGLPVTVILNPEGQEVARMTGDADWSSDSARAVLVALMASGGEG